MAVAAQLKIVNQGEDGVDIAFRADVLGGLSQEQKAIPARWFYDMRGSELFEEITQLPEYYPTRVETGLLKAHASEIAQLVGSGRVVVEFGSGSSIKTPLLLSAIDPAAYVPIDISGEFLGQASADLAAKFPDLPIIPVEADFMQVVRLPDSVREKHALGFFPGSTIGNMVPHTAVDLLRSMRETLGNGAQLLIGIDRVKDTSRLINAYDDAQGVTAKFNLNLLDRMNRELGANIPVGSFRHVARWNDEWSRVEMHLEAADPIEFEISDRRITMRQGETIHTENSHKYTVQQARLLLLASGWSPLRLWSDTDEDFSIFLAEAKVHRSAP